MSSHLMAVRGSLRLKEGITLPMLWSAIRAFVIRFEIKIQEGWAIPQFGEMPLEDPDDNLRLQSNGTLWVNLTCRGGRGMEPDELPSLCEGLDGLVAVGGAIEIVDLDTSPANDDAISVRFVGADLAQRTNARLDYGFGLAKDWLIDVLGPTDYQSVRDLAHQLAAKRLSTQ